MSAPAYTVAVRALCEFTAKCGDLDLRFTPAPSAREGIEGHALVATRRAPPWQAELPLSGAFGALQVRGRADGWDPAAQRLEEIKTYKGRLDAMPANHRALHWAQLKVYGALLCAERGLAEVELALVYFDVMRQTETVFTERHAASALQAFFEDQCGRFVAWAAQESAHRASRDEALRTLAFPHADFRPGQRALAEGVYKAAVAGRCLMAQAPTGIGKTMGTIFPLLKAAPGQSLDKIFYLSAKSPGRALALEAVGLLRRAAPALPLRTLELVARDKACEHPEAACHGDSCPLARGFYDRLPAARQAAAAQPVLDQANLREVALAHAVCPYYLGQEMVRWTDLVVGDYNYWFDLSALLHGLTQAQQWRVALLVDEAHNLVERGRAMYSGALAQDSLRAARHTAPAELKKPLDRLQRAWRALGDEGDAPYEVRATIPERWLAALLQASSAISEFLGEHPTHTEPGLIGFHLEVLGFIRLAELFDAHALCDLTRTPGVSARQKVDTTVHLRNVVPAPFLKPRFEAARSAVLFSATLQPADYIADMLGLPDTTARIEVDSPFDPARLQVHVARQLSTRYADRARSLPALVALIARQFEAAPGNYLAFFSSHDYLQQAAALFQQRHPHIPAWLQSRRMPEAAQRAFIAQLVEGGQGIAFAVLGGAFAEGVDLPGDRLVGAFIATLGLPQVNPVNEQIRQRIDDLKGTGYDYTYLFPGLQKVVQAAGRVIRSATDRGVVHLMDDRFARAEVRRLLPASWWL